MSNNENGAEGALHKAIVTRLGLTVTLGTVVSGAHIGKSPPIVLVEMPITIVGTRTKQTRKQQIQVHVRCLVSGRTPDKIYPLANQVRVGLAPDNPPDLSVHGSFSCIGAMEPRPSYGTGEFEGENVVTCDFLQEFWTVSL